MPWKETVAMKERLSFVARHSLGTLSMTRLCADYGISRKTGYKWINRYADEGPSAFVERSHAPHVVANRVPDDIAQHVIAVRRAHKTWGPRKVLAWLEAREPEIAWPAASTIGDILTSEGLTVPRKKRRRVPVSAPFGACKYPNDVWSIDFKGWFRMRDGMRCDPLTLQDAHSRYLLKCRALARADGPHVWRVLDEAFREFGLPLRMRSDNGPPFASASAGGLSWLAVRLIKAGVTPERIAPGKPQQNGRHERFHLTLGQETASPPAGNRPAQQRAFDLFKHVYNTERPHEALGQTPPAQHYQPSPRHYDGRLDEPEYPDDWEKRRVRSNGEIKWKGALIFVSSALHQNTIGLQPIGDGIWEMSFGPVKLGILDHRGRIVRPSLARRRPRGPHAQTPG